MNFYRIFKNIPTEISMKYYPDGLFERIHGGFFNRNPFRLAQIQEEILGMNPSVCWYISEGIAGESS